MMQLKAAHIGSLGLNLNDAVGCLEKSIQSRIYMTRGAPRGGAEGAKAPPDGMICRGVTRI